MISVRPYRAEDAGALARIFHRAVQIGSAGVYTQAQRDDWSPDCPSDAGWRGRLTGLTTWVAVDGDHAAIVGFMSLRDSDGYLDLAFVTPEHIGQGVGSVLYRQTEAHARELGLHELTVEASAMSMPFFARHGWTITGRKRRGEGAAEMENWLMSKTIIGLLADNHH